MNQVQCNSLFAWCLNVEETGPAVKDCAETKPPHEARNARKSYILFHIMFLFYFILFF